MTDKHIIVIDDEVNICRSIKACLLPEGYIVSDFCDAQLALKSMQTHDYDMAIIDIRLGQQCGIELFKQII